MRNFQMLRRAAVVALFLYGLFLLTMTTQAGPPVRWSVGINVGGPHYHPHHHHHHPHFHYHRPYPYYLRPYPILYPAPVIYEPAPVIVRPAPVIVQPVTSYSSATESFQAPVPTPIAQNPGHAPDQGALDVHLKRLTHADDNVRRDSVMELGRSKSEQAVDPLNATLAGDKSPTVRDAAARALGLIGSPRSLTVLIHAAQADPDRDVRHSAQFAVEIIRSNLKK